MILSSFAKRSLRLVKETYIDAVRVLTSREQLKSAYGVSLYRNAIYLVLNSVVGAVLGFVFWILAARLYSPEEVGLASAVIAAASFLAMLSTVGLDYGLIRFIPNSGRKVNVLVNSCFTLSGAIAILVSLVFLAGIRIWSPALVFLLQNPFNFGSFVVIVITWSIWLLLFNVFVGQRKAGFALLQNVGYGFVRLALILPLAFLGAAGIFTSWGIGFTVIVIVGLLLLLPRLQSGYRPLPTIRKEAISEMAHFSFANYIVALISGVPFFIIPLMIVNLLGAEQNAYYYIGYAVALPLLYIPRSVSFALFAEASHNAEKLGQYVNRSLKFSFSLLIPAIIIIFLVGDKILLLFGKGYSEQATQLLWILALSALPTAVNYAYYTKKRVEKQMKTVLSLSVLSLAITLGLSYLLLPAMGIIGAGIAWLASRGLVSLVIMGRFLIR